MADDLNVTLEEVEGGGRYVGKVSGLEGEAQMTFRTIDDQTILVDHTGVPGSMAGRGVATQLVGHVVEDARQKGLTIIPQCSFVRAQAMKIPEWQDVITLKQ